ncbi:hypothetical protein ACU7RR_002288 [Providencia stuartii]|nr:MULTISPECIES: hypothetical protein [Providencia]MDE8747109.1 hypothetical protein [Providencia thailandensis]MDE8765672.1 hypothetical protein [Providencia thailandensis]MDE8777908.1 hypothetical protein [Providencia thailandensis]MDE8782356.1 hypothetical protein [Providencia thailandensis]MDE8786158.1 hypothetical protein [Providencia thailandensis]
MSKDLFTLENINKVKVLFSPYNEDSLDLSVYSSAHWCIHQLSTLSEDDISQALYYLSVWDLVYEPFVTVTELTKIDSDVWQYCIASPLSEGNKIIPIVGACAVLGSNGNAGVLLEQALLAAGNFAFAILAKQQFDAETINDFDNLDLKSKKRKAAKAKSDIYYGPIKAQMIEWAKQVINTNTGKITKAELTAKVDAKYREWIATNPVGSESYTRLHPFNKNNEIDKVIAEKTIYSYVAPLLTTKKSR